MKIMKLTTMILLVFAPLAMLLGADDGKPVKEPSELTAARQAYQAEQARATAAYVAKLEALKTKLGTSGRIDDAILVKAEVDKIKAEQDAEPTSVQIVGKWDVVATNGYTAVWTITADGKVVSTNGSKNGTWKKAKDKITVTWENGVSDSIILPLKFSGTKGNSGVLGPNTLTIKVINRAE